MLKRLTVLLRNQGPKYLFSSSKQHQFQLKIQMLKNYRQYQPWKNIWIMYELTQAQYDPDISSTLKKTYIRQYDMKIHQVIDQLSGQMHKVPHREINILLEIMKERNYRYDNDVPVFRALNKNAKLLFGKGYRQQYLPKTLFYLRALGFPKSTITKIFEQYATALRKMERLAQNSPSIVVLLQLAIISLEQASVPLPIVQSIVKFIVKQNVSTLVSLCNLYHLSSIIQPCLNMKIEYQLAKTTTRQILFNQFNHLNEETSTAAQSQQKDPVQSEHTLQNRRKLVDISEEILRTFNNEVDLKRLQQSIIKSVQSDIEPFTKTLVLYVCCIEALRPQIEKFIAENMQKLSPIEICYLAKQCKDGSLNIIQAYMSKMKDIMNIKDKCYIYSELSRHYRRPISGQVIINMLGQIQSIEYQEFKAIARLTEHLPKSQQRHIEQIIKTIKEKIEENGPKPQDDQRQT